ncbi:hypothetical protein [Actinomadura sp. 3N407]|uniref:hypothetical protein n=1 Tax=Actinomadura sp. 3N407 TaxID=3457423 RepID=UPI003FCDF810
MSGPGKRETAAQKAARIWDGLNDRQRTYMRVVYEVDQEVERDAKSAWTRGERSVPAAEWRWLDYGPVGESFGNRGLLQERLGYAGVRDSGAGATLKVLEERGLIQTRRPAAPIADYWLEVQLTKSGRAVCRAAGLDPARPGARRKGMLGEGLWRMLAEVYRAEPDGKKVWGYSGAWRHLTEREPDPLVEMARRYDGPDRARLTDAGRAHYEQLWEAYARAYPAVDAPAPGGHPRRWPSAVDERLAQLQQHTARLRTEITATRTARRALDTLPESAARVDVPAEDVDADALPAPLQAAVRRRNRAAATCRTAADRAADRYRAALGKAADAYIEALAVYLTELEEAYRAACTRYVMAAAAVCQATADGTDPLDAFADVDPAAAGGWPRLPAVPVTGLAEVDADLVQAHTRAGGKPRRRRKNTPPETADVLADGARLTTFADAISDYLAGGHLTRLLLRRPPK